MTSLRSLDAQGFFCFARLPQFDRRIREALNGSLSRLSNEIRLTGIKPREIPCLVVLTFCPALHDKEALRAAGLLRIRNVA
jgi:hypothetical protein